MKKINIDQSNFRETNFKHLLILALIWLVGVLFDRLWFALDHSVPAWDQADYLNGAMNYWRALALQHPQWLDGEWWRNFWLLSSKIPPLTYIATAPFLNFFGTTLDAAILVLSLFSAILLLSVYGLGVALFNPTVALWAAALCQILPGLYRYRLEFLLDYPVSAVVTLSFTCLTLWRMGKNQWWWTIIWGLSLGIALMVKQTALLFLLVPILWVVFTSLFQRKWQQFIQLLLSFFISGLVFFPWYRTNWLLILTSGKRATIDSAIAEGDPALNTLDAWLYYLKILPLLISIPLLVIPLVGLVIYWWRGKVPKSNSWRWLAVFLVGGYLLSSVNINKDARYILPLLPVISLILACGLCSWQKRLGSTIRYLTVGLGLILMVANLFPLGGELLTNHLSPRIQHYVYLGKRFPVLVKKPI